MNEGRFLQIGTPDDIYETPRTVFVASFMGASNIFSGKVVSKRDAKIELETQHGARIIAPAPEDFEDDDIAGFSVHPEMIHIEPLEASAQQVDPEKHTAFRGVIEEVFYQGNFSEITVVIKESDTPLTVFLTRGAGPEVHLSEGQDVIVSWACRRNNVLRK
jgi:spermidine/putrescine transport system ATP-binding protein